MDVSLFHSYFFSFVDCIVQCGYLGARVDLVELNWVIPVLLVLFDEATMGSCRIMSYSPHFRCDWERELCFLV